MRTSYSLTSIYRSIYYTDSNKKRYTVIHSKDNNEKLLTNFISHTIIYVSSIIKIGEIGKMKLTKMLFLVILFRIGSNTYADIGTHNFHINIGGGYLIGSTQDRLIRSNLGFYVDVPGFDFNGPIFKTEIGYLLHGVKANGLVNGLDIRANFTMSWRKGLVIENPTGRITQLGNSLGGGLQITYTLGAQLKNGNRIMFDIIGFGVSFHQYNITQSIHYNDGKASKTKNLEIPSSFSSEYILPGIHFISKNGITIGIRNILKMSRSDQYFMPNFDFSTDAYIGMTFGK